MSKITKYPKVIIAGRTNVGKSTLFNRFSKGTRAIVLHEEGVTRDYVSEIISWDNKKFELVDTGGISLKKKRNATDPILEQVRVKVLEMLSKAAIILFVCDAKNGLVQEDLQIAKVLHKTNKPVLLLLNKADNQAAYESNYPEFYKLGFKDILPISATHGTGMVDLLEKITEHVNAQAEEVVDEKPEYKVTILGKPNVGKSSLMNILARKDRSIVTEVAGTTREAISETIYSSQDLVKITDTAGVRRKSRVAQDLESLMVKSSLEAVRTSDIVMIMIDASTTKLTDQELKLLFYAYEQKKSILILLNNCV